ncbi:BTAD domain-containing putative transcriptional regulator [Priestia abyssalis]|uniref:BTAD domain-containing putative transcriptional regulator n=1 Tax=Priestia abyssalis TaxID=1221450 RepID=UPI000994B15F|nr:BTAD domain-containing putative transcriptional regulator [Priestia abyssalis]
MPPKAYVMETKISIPALKGPILQRPQLMKKMQQISQYPLTVIHSGPGYGKSTMLVSFVQSIKEVYGWYSLDRSDYDLIPFLRYMTYSLRKKLPMFGEQFLTYISELEHHFHEEDIHFLCALFINEISAYDQKIIFVLDDVHHVLHSEDIQRFIEWLLEHQPPNFFLVLSSRIKINWTFLPALRVKKHLLEITQEDLALSKEEIDVLVNDYYHCSLCPADVEVISHVTEGWMIAVQMIIQQMKESEHAAEFLHNKQSSLEELFSFLAMEVFMNQPPDIQQFLLKTSIFEQIDSYLCLHVLHIQNARPILEELQMRNLFLMMNGEGQFRYHALFREFLEMHLKKNRELYHQLHMGAASYFLKQKQYLQALQHYKSIECYKEIAHLLGTNGEEMLERGYLHQMKEILDQMPETIKNEHYMAWYFEGEVYRYHCMYQKAGECYQKAAEFARTANDVNGEGKAAEGQAKIYLDTIQPRKAECFLEHAVACLERHEASSAGEKAKLYYLMAENLLNGGSAARAKKWYEKGKSLKAGLDDKSLEIRLQLRTGNLESARKKLIEKQKDAPEMFMRLQQSHRENVLLLSLIESWAGNPEEAKKLANDGIKRGVKVKAPFLEACGWTRMGHAVQLLERYDSDLAQKCYETALEIMDDLSVSRGKAEAFMGLCLLHGFNGSYETAIHQGKRALKETDSVNDSWMSGFIQLCMGVVAVHNEKWKEGVHFLLEAQRLFHHCGDGYGQSLVYMWQTFSSYENGQWQEFEQLLSAFWESVEQGGYEYLLFKRSMFGPRDLKRFIPILLEGQKRNVYRTQMIRLLEESGIGDAASHPGYTLRFQTLGAFRVWLGGQEIQERDWQRAKAKELLELFVTNRRTLLQKQEIIAYLWANVEEETALRDFKVALNALNNVLEPNRKARGNTFYIRRVESAYGLNEQADYEMDVINFEKKVQKGLEEGNEQKAMHCLQEGLALYKGEYLPNRRYEDWCIHEKEKLKLYFLRGAEKLASLLMNDYQYDQVIMWCEKILEQDALWEEAYRLLMVCYMQKNNRPQALKVYQKCREQLKKELGISPSIKTEQVYEMIVKM